jgi:arylsulfatase A-like enzyme
LKPNIIYILADQLRVQSLGYAGDERAHTPNIDRLRTASMDFPNAVSCCPLCAPYRASLLTGKYPTTTGVVANELRMNPAHHTFLGEVFGQAGYRTDLIGKWHLWSTENENRDADENQFVPPGPYRFGFDDYWAAYNFWRFFHSSFYYENDSPERVPMGGYEADVLTDLAIRRIEQHAEADESFAAFLFYGPPHPPWTWDNAPQEFREHFQDMSFAPPPNYADGHAKYWAPSFDENWWQTTYKPHLEESQRVYYAMIANLDRNVGVLLDALEAHGLAGNTIVVLTSDHGDMLGAHGRAQKTSFYDESARVPFLMRWPGHIEADSTNAACLNTPDIMPTLLGLVGLSAPSDVEGDDLSSGILGGDGAGSPAALLQSGTGTHWLFDDGFEWRALRSPRFTYARTRGEGTELLFDHVADPYQMNNLVLKGDSSEVLTQMRSVMQERMYELRDTFESASWYRDNWIQNGCVLRGAKEKEPAQ